MSIIKCCGKILSRLTASPNEADKLIRTFLIKEASTKILENK